MFKRVFIVGAAAAAGVGFGISKARGEFRSWGIDPAARNRELPGDDLVPEAEAIDTRCVDIAAPPEEVWPWLVQMGYGRAGWYSWDQLDMNMPSADRIVPELQHLAVGDILPTHPGGGFEVRAIEPGHALVLFANRAIVETQAAAAPAKAAGDGFEAASKNVRPRATISTWRCREISRRAGHSSSSRTASAGPG